MVLEYTPSAEQLGDERETEAFAQAVRTSGTAFHAAAVATRARVHGTFPARDFSHSSVVRRESASWMMGINASSLFFRLTISPKRGSSAKTADNAARIATLLQLFEDGGARVIGLEALQGAARIAAWHLSEAPRF